MAGEPESATSGAAMIFVLGGLVGPLVLGNLAECGPDLDVGRAWYERDWIDDGVKLLWVPCFTSVPNLQNRVRVRIRVRFRVRVT